MTKNEFRTKTTTNSESNMQRCVSNLFLMKNYGVCKELCKSTKPIEVQGGRILFCTKYTSTIFILPTARKTMPRFAKNSQNLPRSNKDQPKDRQACPFKYLLSNRTMKMPSPKMRGRRCHAAWCLQYKNHCICEYIVIYLFLYIYIYV